MQIDDLEPNNQRGRRLLGFVTVLGSLRGSKRIYE
jgi:hypothetical protein